MRSQKLDALRGMALIGMIFFHANYLLEEVFHISSIYPSDTFWYILGRTVAIAFIMVAGVSFFLWTQGKNDSQILRNTIKRSAILALVAGGISFFTNYFFYEQRISWGIIHFFALSSILGFFMRRFWSFNFLIGILCIILWFFLSYIEVNTSVFIPLGIYPWTYFSSDYYPLIPWFGYYLLGYGWASFLYSKKSLSSLIEWKIFLGNFLAFFGKHSLVIYVCHVPILYIGMSLYF